MAGTVRSRTPVGLRRWFAVFGGVGLWMVHICGSAALATVSCRSTAALWTLHLLTALTLAGTVLAMWWSWTMVRTAGPVGEAEPGPGGRDRFLGLFGLATGAISALLIVWEGSYVLVIDACRSL
jgi:hypothetical protein